MVALDQGPSSATDPPDQTTRSLRLARTGSSSRWHGDVIIWHRTGAELGWREGSTGSDYVCTSVAGSETGRWQKSSETLERRYTARWSLGSLHPSGAIVPEPA
jgi:hypothetical protein